MDIVLEGATPFNGRYPLIPFNRYEQGQIRRLAGWMPTEYEDALRGGDAEFICVLAVLSLHRAGRVERRDVQETYERILDMDGAEITLEGDPVEEGEEDDGPPPQSSSLSSDTSGPGSSRSSETLRKTPPSNGTPDSATSVSVPGMLGN